MTGIIAIDESGDTSPNGSRFFVMAAVIANRSRILLPTSKLINNTRLEMKYHDSSTESKRKILSALSKTNATITYVSVDKYDYHSVFYNRFGNELYKLVFKKLIDNLKTVSPVKELNLLLDKTSSIQIIAIKQMVSELDCPRIIKYGKYNSRDNKCIQIADFVAGAIKARFEYNNEEFYSIIERSIRCP